MNEDTKLECLRLAVDFCSKAEDIQQTNPLVVAKSYYEWVTSEDKPNTINYEKTLSRSANPGE